MTKREKCRTAFVLFWTVLNLGSKLPSPKQFVRNLDNPGKIGKRVAGEAMSGGIEMPSPSGD